MTDSTSNGDRRNLDSRPISDPTQFPDLPVTVVLDRIPLGRHGQPSDVVNAAIYLASDESSWVSGTNIVVDGGASTLG